jgi:hypothetical protein
MEVVDELGDLTAFGVKFFHGHDKTEYVHTAIYRITSKLKG